jgi:hypothetical protein
LAVRQFSTAKRFTGFLSEERLVWHEGFLLIGPKANQAKFPLDLDASLRPQARPGGHRPAD